MGKLDNKIAFITGGASGMGKRMTELFQEEGAYVIAADINKELLEEFDQSNSAEGKYLNVASEEDWERAIEEVISQHGRIDILVNNAGISSEKQMEDITIEDWDKMMRINSFGPFAGMKHVLPHMVKQQYGSIVNISSYTAMIGMGTNTYTASKGAVRSISKAASAQYGRKGIRVNAVFPGVIKTPMTEKLNDTSVVMERLIAATPLQKLGTATDVAKAVLFLASEDAAFITGAELVIDGGYSAQ
ncbi:SDR family NAD(P)-dependent oxidoreductase [Bacillus sp. es.036]|uniref:SDR family NAD(P)-dependent oxidoreductase n=1 Tax=Bacillus sp. es.036 TaxID=1761764 RepID=UPI000BF6574B|nr:SDR family oxidoreductase [Bacillus sp. es.036]PFG14434.1 NAD(P)-dependent dehydrogenase (short-subunit alcohol dehydrogenase family) [Bacillus sp. es.036]